MSTCSMDLLVQVRLIVGILDNVIIFREGLNEYEFSLIDLINKFKAKIT